MLDMKRNTPLLTLLAGTLVAVALFGASSLATARASSASSSSASSLVAVASASPVAAPSVAPSVRPSVAASVAPVNAVWAGHTTEGEASIAISVKNGVAVAYVCDGKREIWLQGTAAAGKLALTGAKGAKLTGTFGGGKAKGSVTSGSAYYTFTAPAVTKPSGLYRATAQVRNATVVGGWIVLADGYQVGVYTSDDVPRTAPPIDPATGAVTLDGTTLTAAYVDGEVS
jgi:serine/threonine-protein kinase